MFFTFYLIDARLHTISWADLSAPLSTQIDTEKHFLTVNLFKKEVCTLHVQYFSPDGVDTLLGFFTAFHGMGLTAWYLSTGVKLPIHIRLRDIGQTQAQHGTTRGDTDDFGNRYNRDLID